MTTPTLISLMFLLSIQLGISIYLVYKNRILFTINKKQQIEIDTLNKMIEHNIKPNTNSITDFIIIENGKEPR